LDLVSAQLSVQVLRMISDYQLVVTHFSNIVDLNLLEGQKAKTEFRLHKDGSRPIRDTIQK
jgi:hypothetical protein